MAVQASSYPYVGLMAFSGSRTRLIAASEGLCTPAQLLAMLQEAVNQYGAEFVADQAEASQVVSKRHAAASSCPVLLATSYSCVGLTASSGSCTCLVATS